MNLRYACVKAIKEYGLQEENEDNKKDMDSFGKILRRSVIMLSYSIG